MTVPSAVSATANGSTRIIVRWEDTNVGVTEFQVERSVKPRTSFRRIASMGGSARAFQDEGLSPGDDLLLSRACQGRFARARAAP